MSAGPASAGRWRRRYGPPTMWARHARNLLATLVEVGADGQSMLRAGGLVDADLADADGRVPLEAVYEAIEVALDQTGDPLLGVHVAQRVTMDDLDAMGFLLLTSHTMGEAIERINHFADAFVSGERYHWFVDTDGVHHEFIPYGPDRPAHRHVAEMIFHHVARSSPDVLGPQAAPVEIRFPHQPCAGVDYEALFGVPVLFGQPRAEVLFPPVLRKLEVPGATTAMANLVDRYLDGLRTQLPDEGSLTAQVVDHIDRTMEHGPPTLASVASATAMSPRSLQRQLRSEGTSLSALVDSVRSTRAQVLLSAGVPTVEVAFLLGYADQSAFQRAFRRWTATTPAAFRRRRT